MTEVTIVTVHGTNAGRPEVEGSQWWQRRSAFQLRLAELLARHGVTATFEPFQWGATKKLAGENSETTRRLAGLRLSKRLDELDKAGKPFRVIGHSHGGTVLTEALRWAAFRRKPLSNYGGMTIGTPYLAFRRFLMPYRRYDLVGLALLLVYSIVFILAGLEFARELDAGITAFNEHADDIDRLLSAVGVGALAIALYIIPFVILFRTFNKISIYRHSIFSTGRFRKLFGRTDVFYAADDEAIALLNNTKRTSLKVIDGSITRHFFRNVTFALLVAGAVASMFAHFDGSIPDASRFVQAFDWLTFNYIPLISDHEHSYLIFAVTLPVLIVGPALIYSAITDRFARYFVGPIFASQLNDQVSRRVRNQIFGDDIYGEQVTDVLTAPQKVRTAFNPVPAAIANELSAAADSQAVEALAKARAVLGLTHDAPRSRDLAKTLAEQFEWDELIHTTYFDNEKMIRLVAHAILDSLPEKQGKRAFDTVDMPVSAWHASLRPLPTRIGPIVV